MQCKVITTWFIMGKSFNASSSNSQLGIVDHAVVDATFLLDQSKMVLLLEHLGRLYTVRQIGTSIHCLVVMLAFPAEIREQTSSDNIRHKLPPESAKRSDGTHLSSHGSFCCEADTWFLLSAYCFIFCLFCLFVCLTSSDAWRSSISSGSLVWNDLGAPTQLDFSEW